MRIRRDGGMTYAGVGAVLNQAVIHSKEWIETLDQGKEWNLIPYTVFINGDAHVTLFYGLRNQLTT